jgi:hypothetical protein
MSRDDGGGWIVLKGDHHPSVGYRIQPGIRLSGSYHPTMYSQTPNITPHFSGPVFTFTDGVDFGSRKAWGGSTLENVQVNPQTEGLMLINGEGGNGSEIRNVSSSMGKHPIWTGISVAAGREHDFQYSTLDRVRLTRVIHAVDWYKNAPDCIISRSMFYGGDIPESTSLRAFGRNLTVQETSFQFVAKGPLVDTLEFEMHGGQWENRSGGSQFADYAFKVGPNTRDMTVRSLSLANFGSLIGPVFYLSPNAADYTFEYLSGHVGPQHVPSGFEDHFVWHRA